MLNVDRTQENGALMIALEGELDTLSAPVFEDMLEPMLTDAQSLTLDFEKLEYISSAGLRILLAAEQAMEEKGAEKVRVINANSTIRNILDITGFMDVLAVE